MYSNSFAYEVMLKKAGRTQLRGAIASARLPATARIEPTKEAQRRKKININAIRSQANGLMRRRCTAWHMRAEDLMHNFENLEFRGPV